MLQARGWFHFVSYDWNCKRVQACELKLHNFVQTSFIYHHNNDKKNNTLHFDVIKQRETHIYTHWEQQWARVPSFSLGAQGSSYGSGCLVQEALRSNSQISNCQATAKPAPRAAHNGTNREHKLETRIIRSQISGTLTNMRSMIAQWIRDQMIASLNPTNTKLPLVTWPLTCTCMKEMISSFGYGYLK